MEYVCIPRMSTEVKVNDPETGETVSVTLPRSSLAIIELTPASIQNKDLVRAAGGRLRQCCSSPA